MHMSGDADTLLGGALICRELDMGFCFIFILEVAFRIYIERWNFPKDWNCREGGKVWPDPSFLISMFWIIVRLCPSKLWSSCHGFRLEGPDNLQRVESCFSDSLTVKRKWWSGLDGSGGSWRFLGAPRLQCLVSTCHGFQTSQTINHDQQPSKPSNQAGNQSINQSINRSVSQSINQSINRSVSQSINRTSKHAIKWPIKQGSNHFLACWLAQVESWWESHLLLEALCCCICFTGDCELDWHSACDRWPCGHCHFLPSCRRTSSFPKRSQSSMFHSAAKKLGKGKRQGTLSLVRPI